MEAVHAAQVFPVVRTKPQSALLGMPGALNARNSECLPVRREARVPVDRRFDLHFTFVG